MGLLPRKLLDLGRATSLAARLVGGRRFYLVPLWSLLWPALLAVMVVTGGFDEKPSAQSAQGWLIGVPMAVLAIFLGGRVIAGEVDSRRLEIAYTVPGGSHRLWTTKLLAAWMMLLGIEVLLALVAFVFFTSYPPSALYGALQAATFYLVFGMWMSTLVRSEVAGALLSIVLLAVNGVFTGFGDAQSRLSPFWNALAAADDGVEADAVLAWTVQNRIGFALAVAAVTALAFGRAERREKMLSG